MTADQPEPWWANDPELKEFQRRSYEAFQREVEALAPIASTPPVTFERDAPGCMRALRMAREDVERAKSRYEQAILTAREVGLSWAQIGAALGVSRQFLHRRYGGRSVGG